MARAHVIRATTAAARALRLLFGRGETRLATFLLLMEPALDGILNVLRKRDVFARASVSGQEMLGKKVTGWVKAGAFQQGFAITPTLLCRAHLGSIEDWAARHD